MSLKIWLPLNGSLDEKIGNKSIVAANNLSLPSTSTPGKIGQGYTFSNNGIKIASIQATSQMSFAMWVKLSSNTLCHLLDFRTSDGNTGYQPIYYENDQIQIYSAANTQGPYRPAKLSDLKWHHLTVTMQNGDCRLYVDGVLSGNPITEIAMYDNVVTDLNIGCRCNGNNPCQGVIQDVRIYNHVLSPREVKLLAQGLIIHYKLNNGNHTNLISGSYNFSGIASSGDTIQSDTTTGIISRKHNNTTADYWELAAWNGIITANANDVYTASFLARSENATKLTVYLWNNNSGVQVSNIKSSQGHNKGGTDGSCELQLTTEWKWYWITWTFNSTTTPLTKNLLFRLFKNNAAEIARVKLEKGAIPTTYGLSPSEMNQFGYDCSGYGNHGITSAALKMSTDSSRYSHSTVFENNKYIQCPTRSYEGMKDTYTFSYWAKMPIGQMTNKMVWGIQGSGNLDVFPSDTHLHWNVGDGYENPFQNESTGTYPYPNDGQWHCYTITGNGSKTILYLDGTYAGTALTYRSMPNVGTLFLSGWNASDTYRWNNGQISDFRIYATTLSAAAVKELYQSGISLLDNGTLRCSEIVENSTNLKFEKNGVVQANQINEIGYIDKATIKKHPDGSLWARIYNLDVRSSPNESSLYFSKENNEVDYCVDKSNRFSLMQYSDRFCRKNGEYEFMLTYPNNYTELEYIEATGSQYINTGINTSARWEFDIQFNPDGARQLMGYSGNGWNYWGLKDDISYEIEWHAINYVAPGKRHTIVHDFENKTLTINGVQREIEYAGEPMGTYTMFSLGTAYYCKAKLYRCKCYQGSSLIRDFVPVERRDGAVGLLDVVNGTFYGSSGDNFSKGPAINIDTNTFSNPNICNRWAQTNSPKKKYDDASGYRRISTAFRNSSLDSYVGPLTLSNSSGSAKYSANRSGNWWSPIGQYTSFTADNTIYGIPASDGNTYQWTELWVRIDNLKDLQKTSLFNQAIQTYQIYEA